MNLKICLACAMAVAGGSAGANEVTIQNDSLVNFGNAAIVWGFVAGEAAGSWLTTPCTGNLVAVQVFWLSPTGTEKPSIEDSIDIYRAGTFPEPGELALEVAGPVLTDNALNEFRYLDENGTIPISVPVVAEETLVVALTFAETPIQFVDPSVVRDTDGIQPGRNALYGDIGAGLQWYDASLLGIAGDWVIRAVVDCEAGANDADVAVTMSADPPAYTAGSPLTYTISIANAGPANALNTTIVDTFPAALNDVEWTCTASGGATCPAQGSGMIAQSIALPAGGQAVFHATGTIASGTTGPISNTATAVVGAPATDPDTDNNTASLLVESAGNDTIFADGFDAAGRDIPLTPVAARASNETPGEARR